MYCYLKFLIKWLSHEVIKKNMPPAFKQLYPDCICIINCSEIPGKYEARSATYSNNYYKKHNTEEPNTMAISVRTPCKSLP